MASRGAADTSSMSLDIKMLLEVSQAGSMRASKLNCRKTLRGCLQMAVATKGSDEKWPGGLERALVLSLLPLTVGVTQRRGGQK